MNNFELSFQIDLASPCSDPGSVNIMVPNGTPVSVDYFLTDSDEYVLPAFTVNPSFCELSYFFEVTPSAGISGISFDSDPL